MESTTTVIESQPDWLTVGTQGAERTDALRRAAESWIREEQDAGGRVRPFRLLGNSGYQCGRVRFGQREEHGLLQLSGDLARERWDHALALADRVSRLDLAVTVHLESGPSVYPASHYAEALAFRERFPRAVLPKLVQDGDGGSTLYLGKRESNFMLRVYNKEAEQRAQHDQAGAEHYAGCLRYELEIKGDDASRWAEEVSLSTDRANLIQGLIWQWCTGHGLILPFRVGRWPSAAPRLPSAQRPRLATRVDGALGRTSGQAPAGFWRPSSSADSSRTAGE